MKIEGRLKQNLYLCKHAPDFFLIFFFSDLLGGGWEMRPWAGGDGGHLLLELIILIGNPLSGWAWEG